MIRFLCAKAACVLTFAAINLGLAVIPAQAGGVRISAINSGGRSVLLPFSVTCAYPDGSESNSVSYSVWTGSSTVVNGCRQFSIYFTSSRGGRYSYAMYAGRSYYFQWNGTRWAFFEN
ncbi:hypothetical protein AB4037_27595 [Labrys sp. KB_33_2]|uniref:hypothetical protein n=1 Tax=unclassified Labrys (in: a-proteobacteria) TaxID=2688601 RepID=UPI003EB9E996